MAVLSESRAVFEKMATAKFRTADKIYVEGLAFGGLLRSIALRRSCRHCKNLG